MYAAYNFQYLLNVFMARRVINTPVCIYIYYDPYIIWLHNMCLYVRDRRLIYHFYPALSSFRNCVIRKFKKLNMPNLRRGSNNLKAGITDTC